MIHHCSLNKDLHSYSNYFKWFNIKIYSGFEDSLPFTVFCSFRSDIFFIIPSSRHHIAFLRALRNGGSKSQNTKQFGRKFFGKPKCATFVEGIPEKF